MQQGVDLSFKILEVLRCSLSQGSSCAMEQGLPALQAAQDSGGVGIIKEFVAEAAPSLSSAQGWQCHQRGAPLGHSLARGGDVAAWN